MIKKPHINFPRRGGWELPLMIFGLGRSKSKGIMYYNNHLSTLSAAKKPGSVDELWGGKPGVGND